MKLVIDANRLFSVIIGKRLNTASIGIFFSDDAELYAPFRLLAELENNRDEIRFKSGFSHEDFNTFVSVIKLRVKFIPLEDFIDNISEVKKISPHSKDIEYFALALKLDCSVWSNEKLLKEQSQVKILSTTELFKLLFP